MTSPISLENRKIIIVGIPGVGKTTLVSRIVSLLLEKNKTVSVVSFGTLMFEAARKAGVDNRDGLRQLGMSQQRDLQVRAAMKIASMDENVVIIDTHAFISTPSGFYPGLPEHVLKVIAPSNFISVTANPEEIYNRRMNDPTRRRDIISISAIKREMDVQNAMLSTCSVLSGSPLKSVMNGEGKVQEAAQSVIDAIGL
jgi:adenylate kinase